MKGYLLRGGNRTADPRLDRIYSQDLRSLNFDVTKKLSLVERLIFRSYTWRVGVNLDQGQEGACVGFGYAHELASIPVVVTGINNRFARERIYWEVQKIDEWDGGSYPGANPVYEGTSVLDGAKLLKNYGYYKSYDWGITAQDVAAAIGSRGPAVLGVNWYTGMFDPDANGWIHATGEIEGGHCILAHGVSFKYKGFFGNTLRTWSSVDLDKSYVWLWNSWGPTWGEGGRAKLSLRDLQKLIEIEKGEACFPVRNEAIRTVL